MNNKLFRLGALVLVLLLMTTVSTFAQLATVYVDGSNGSDTWDGSAQTHTALSTGPVATIAKGLTLVANNGTVVIMAGQYAGQDGANTDVNITAATYTQLTSGLTIELRTLNANTKVEITGTANFIVNLPGATLNITQTNASTEYLNIATAVNFQVIAGSVNIPTASMVRLLTGSTITMNGSASFSGVAPQKGTNLSLSYTGTGASTAGPEANYTTYGTGTLTVNKTSSGAVTFPYAMSVAGITITAGNVTFQNNMTVGTSDIINNATANTVTFTGTVALTITSNAATDANLSRIVNNNTGAMNFNGAVTWSATGLSAAGTLDWEAAVIPAIDNNANGQIAFNSTITLAPYVSTSNATRSAIIYANNAAGANSTMTFAAILETGNSSGTAGVPHDVFFSIHNAGTVNMTVSTTVNRTIINSGTITLGANTLTLPSTNGHTFTGGTISGTGSTVVFSANGVTATNGGGGILPSISIPSGGALTVSGTMTVNNLTEVGNLTLAAASVLKVKGDFNRTAGTFSAIAGGSDLQFTGTTAQAFNCGPNFTVEKLTFSNTTATVTIGSSIRATNVVTINTNANVSLSTLNIVLKAATAKMINNGAYSATGAGGVVLGGVNTIPDFYSGNGVQIAGNGTYSYIIVDVGAGNTASAATLNDNVKFNGVLTLRSGNLVADGTTAGGKVNICPTGTSASIISFITSAGNSGKITTTGTGTFNGNDIVAGFVPSDYDLTYQGAMGGAAGVTIGVSEYDATHIKNLTVSTTGGTLTLTRGVAASIKGNLTLTGTAVFALDASAFDFEVKGTLSIATGATLSGGNAANLLKLSGDGMTHSIPGTLSAISVLTVTGNGATINGLTATGDPAAIQALDFEPTVDNATLNVQNLVNIGGAVTAIATSTNVGASLTINMNATNSTMGGGLALGASKGVTASVKVAGTTTSSFTGNVTVSNGSALTLTRGGADTTVTGVLTLNKGSLTLGSDVYVVGTVVHSDAVINLGAYYLTINGATYNMSGATAAATFFNATTGYVVFVTTPCALTPYGTATTIPNLQVNVNLTLAGPLTVSGVLEQTSGAIALGGNNLTVSGTQIIYTAGTYTAGAGILKLTGPLTFTAAGNVAIPNLTINAGTGTVTFAADDGKTARTFSVTTAFVQTDGNIALQYNNLYINGATFVRAAGSWSQGSGYLQMNCAAPDFGTGFAIDNIDFQAAATPAVGTDTKTKAFTVAKKLMLTAGTLTVDAGRLTLGDGVLITRAANTALMSSAPTFAGTSSNTYKTAGAITTTNELQSTVTNFTASVAVTLAKSITINSTLTASALITAGANTITMADNSTFELQAVGTGLLDKNLVKLGSLNIVYNFSAPAATSIRELGAVNTSGSLNGYYAGPVGNVTIKGTSDVQLGAHFLIGGKLTFATQSETGPVAGGNLDLDPAATSYIVQVQGDVVQTGSAPGFFSSTTAASVSSVKFTGANNTLLTLSQPNSAPAVNVLYVPAGIKIYIAKSNANNTVTMSGADLNFVANSQMPYFVNGLLVVAPSATKGFPAVVLAQGVSAGNQPTQGYDITGMTGTNQSGVYGSVRKLIDVVGGTPSIQNSRVIFPTAGSALNAYYRPYSVYFKTQPPASLNLTVSHVDMKAGGQNGFPIYLTGKTITNYPNFFWYMTSDIGVSPSFKYDMDAQAQGYTDYALDGIQNVRFVRRDSGNVNNPWVLQGADANYDNSTISASWPVVKVIDATGGITTNGSIFTYSQNNKAPAWTTAPTNLIANEGDTLTINYAATDPDFGDTPTITSVTLPTGATMTTVTGNPMTAKVTWIVPYTLATKAVPTATATLTLRTTDTYGPLSRDTTITITVNNVNRKPNFAATGSAKLAATTTKDGVALAFNYIALDPDGDAVTYVGVGLPTGATVSTAGALAWTPTFAQAGSPYTITVVASDGLLTDTASAVVTVNKSVLLGDVDKNGTVGAADASLILKHAAGLQLITDPAALWAADVTGNGQVTAYDAAYVLYYASFGAFPSAAPTPATHSLAKIGEAAGALSWSAPEATKDADVLKVGLNISNSANVYAVQLSSKINASLASVEGVNAAIPEGWEMQWSFNNGELRVAMAGATPLPSGSVATVMVRLKDKESRLSFSTDAVLNEAAQSVGAVEVAAIPASFALDQNYPNPFNPSTTVRYQIPNDANVALDIYNLQGQKIRTLVSKEQKAGYYSVVWDGRNEAGQTVSSGLYLYRVQAGSFVATHKMLMIK